MRFHVNGRGKYKHRSDSRVGFLLVPLQKRRKTQTNGDLSPENNNHVGFLLLVSSWSPSKPKSQTNGGSEASPPKKQNHVGSLVGSPPNKKQKTKKHNNVSHVGLENRRKRRGCGQVFPLRPQAWSAKLTARPVAANGGLFELREAVGVGGSEVPMVGGGGGFGGWGVGLGGLRGGVWGGGWGLGGWWLGGVCVGGVCACGWGRWWVSCFSPMKALMVFLATSQQKPALGLQANSWPPLAKPKPTSIPPRTHPEQVISQTCNETCCRHDLNCSCQ